MSPEDKQRLKDAFKTAIEHNPAGADEPFTLEGVQGTLTSRQVIENTLKHERFFDEVEKQIAAGKITLDDYAKLLENTSLPIGKPSRPKP